MPSCEGHNRTKNFIDKAWDNLNKDKEKIRTKGLLLNNCENNNKYFLYDPNWDLPFSYKEFYDICSGKNGATGYIAFFCKDKSIYNILTSLFHYNQNIKIKYKNDLLEIFNNSKDLKTRTENWELIHKLLEEIL